MPHYIIATLDIKDRTRYAQYEAGFMDVFSRYQGKMLAVDEEVDVMEGDWSCTRTVLIEFPSAEAARQWYQSKEYTELARHRLAASTGNIALVAGLPPG